MKDRTTVELGMRMAEINKAIDKLLIEYNLIIKELWERYPNTKNDEDMQMKRRIKTKEDL